MRETNLRTIDLNLLIALNALLEEKHVSRAAERVSLSQPAMSRALSRLRDIFADPLLVKSRHGMALTERALSLYPALQSILRDITHIVHPPAADPATMQGEIVIATRDYELAVVLPRVISHILTTAPGLRVNVVPLVGDDLTPLENHQVDFVLSATDKSSATLHRATLFNEGFACLISKKNSLANGPLTLEGYLSLKHCLVTINQFGIGRVDTLLAEMHKKRDIVIRVPHFLAAAHLISSSNLITTLPRQLAAQLIDCGHIVLKDPPFTIPSFSLFLYWHTRNHGNPIHQWVREVIKLHGVVTSQETRAAS